MDDKKAQCPIGFLWHKGTLGKFLSVFLGLALVGILLKSVFWTLFMGLFAIKWIFLIGAGLWGYFKISKLLRRPSSHKKEDQ